MCGKSIRPVIRTIAGNGLFKYAGDGGPATSATLNIPSAVAGGSDGNLWVADTLNGRIRRVNSEGLISTFAGNGSLAFSGDGGPASSASFRSPFGLALDGTGSLYVADASNGRVRKIGLDGIVNTVAGGGSDLGDGGPATMASLRSPMGVAFDSAGNLYIAEIGGHRVRRVSSPNGTITTVAGTGVPGFSGDGGPATRATLSGPSSLAFDSAGNLYIVDRGNHRIRRVDTNGSVRTVAGNGIAGFSGDGGPAASASLRLSDPFGGDDPA